MEGACCGSADCAPFVCKDHECAACQLDGECGPGARCCKGACVPLEVNRRRMPIITHGTQRAAIDRATCMRCFTCREVCLYEVVVARDGQPVIGDCHGCAVCMHNCPSGAIRMREAAPGG